MQEINAQTLPNENKLATAPMLKLIISMSLPAMFSMLIQSLYNVVDSMFVARLGETALTAVSLAFPIQIMLIAVSVGTAVGLNSLVSRRLGEGRQAEANKAATHGILLALFSWVFFAIFGLFFTNGFFQLFTNSSQVLSMSGVYTQIVTIFSFGITVEVMVEKTLQATGNMIYPMVFQLIGAVINLILDPIMIFGLLGCPAMGVAGAAAATVIGQILAMVVSLVVMFAKKHDVAISFKRFRFSWRTVKDIYSVGFPSIIMQAISSLLIMALNAILIGFSEAAVSVLGVYYKLQSFIFMPVFGLTQGVMPIMGYNYGAKNGGRLHASMRIGSIISLVIMALGTILFLFGAKPLLLIFNASPEMLAIGVPALRIICLCFLPAAMGIMYSTLFQAVDMGFRSLCISILRQLVVILPAAYLLSKISLTLVWWSFPIAEGIAFVASLILYIQANNKVLKLLGIAPSAKKDYIA